MTRNLFMGFSHAARLAAVVLVLAGCSGDDDDDDDGAGSVAAGMSGAGQGGSAAGASGKGSGGASGNTAGGGGSSAGAGGSTAGGGGSSAGSGGSTAGSGGSAAGSGGSGAAACKDKAGKTRGKSVQMLMAGGLMRSFVYYAPMGLDANTPAPIVIVAHGYTMSGEQMFEITKYSELADKEKFIVMFPDGEPDAAGPWNVGMPTCSSTLGILPLAEGDDQAFLDAMIAFADADQCVDHDHVYVTGFSMGGYFANATGCARKEIRAIAPHSGGVHELTMCASEHKPVLLMHFNGDALIPTMCGEEARDRWVEHNGCSKDAPEVRMVKGGSCEYYKGCPKDGQVAFCRFDIPTEGNRDEAFAGHAWSGGSDEGDAMGGPFAIPETESASELGWHFFKEFAW